MSLWVKLVVTVREAVVGISLAYQPREAAKSSLIDVCDHAALRLPKLRDLESWRTFSRWCTERVASPFAYKGGQYLSYDSLQPMPALMTQDARPKIVDALLTLISRMGQGGFVNRFISQRQRVHPRRTTIYLRWYFTINSRMSECDHK